MSATCVQGAFAQFAVKQGTGGAVDFSSGAVRLPFYSEEFHNENTVATPDVIVGSRSVPSERARKGPNLTRGTVILPVCANELDTILPLILGASESANLFALAETVPTFSALFDKVSKVYRYSDGVVDSASFHAVQAGPGAPPNFIKLVLNCLFLDENPTAQTFPSLSLGITAGFSPYVFEDSVTTLGGTAYTPFAWTISIRNFIHQRYVASLLPVLNCPTRRAVTASFRFPADSDHLTSLREVALAGLTTNTVAITNGSAVTTFTFGALQAPRDTPFITGHRESQWDVNFVARKVGSTNELAVTNASV